MFKKSALALILTIPMMTTGCTLEIPSIFNKSKSEIIEQSGKSKEEIDMELKQMETQLLGEKKKELRSQGEVNVDGTINNLYEEVKVDEDNSSLKEFDNFLQEKGINKEEINPN